MSETTEEVGGLNKALGETEKMARAANEALEKMTNQMLEGGEGFKAILDGVDGLAKSIESASGAMAHLVGIVPGMGPAAGIVKDLGGIFAGVTQDVATAGRAFGEVIGVLDGFSAPTRRLQDDMFSLAAQFGGTFEDAKNMGDYILDYADKVATKEFGYINQTELNAAKDAFKASKIPIENYGKAIESSAGSMDIFAAGVLHAKALSMDIPTYFNKMGSIILKQGLNAQDAAEQMAMFGDIASTTGLSVDTVSGSLTGLAERFAKLGLTADFGRPLLEGFARTLSGMGLGIENATALAESLGGAMAGLAENYSMAYVVAQRGGLDFGAGGGALGASIGLQARMLEAEKTGDQATLGLEMADAMRETLESFTGGGIVTVQEAAESPELQQTFYTQQKLLEQMFGLDNQTATRTLDYLSDLEQATASGNMDMKNELGEQMAEAITTRDKTMGEMEKLNATSNAQLAQLQLSNITQFEILRNTAAGARGKAEELIGLAAKGDTEGLKSFMMNLPSEIKDVAMPRPPGKGDTIFGEGLSGDPIDKLVQILEQNQATGGESMEELRRMHTNLIGKIDLLLSSEKITKAVREWQTNQ